MDFLEFIALEEALNNDDFPSGRNGDGKGCMIFIIIIIILACIGSC